MGVLAVGAALDQHGIDQSGLAMVYVGDDCDVAQVKAQGHAKNSIQVGARARSGTVSHSTTQSRLRASP